MAEKPTKAKPRRKRKDPRTLGDPAADLAASSGLDTVPRWATADRVDGLDRRLEAFESRLDKMADALAPALHAWRNIRARIPGWILSLGDPPAARVTRPVRLERESPSGDSEE